MLNGILILNKEKGYTSNDAVAKLRGICRQRKIGHTGTLDPNATGVLPMCLGNATKLCELFTDKSKEYIAQLTLGITTDTQDIWGNICSDSGEKWREIPIEEIEKTILSFRGKQKQIPPMYSALKVNGKRLYELARAGAEVERKPREIEIEQITLLPSVGHTGKEAHQTVYFSALPHLRIKVVCSKGTYIRTLCQDIGEKLGCGAVMSSLVRTRVGGFLLENARTLAEIEQIRDKQGLEKLLIPVDSYFADYPAVQVLEEGLRFLRNGNELELSLVKNRNGNVAIQEKTVDGFVRIYDKDGIFYGIYAVHKEKNTLKPWKMFLPE